MTNLPAAITAALFSAAALIQTAPAEITSVVGPVERLTLCAALIIAVYVLWNANVKERVEYRRIIAEKDATIISMATEVTKVMTSVMDAVKESRKASEELGAAVDNLADNIAASRVPPPR